MPRWSQTARDASTTGVSNLATLDKLRAMGVNLIPVELPKLPWEAFIPLLTAEAAAAFDGLTMTGRDRLLTEQGPEDWPNYFRMLRFYPAVEYIQANRARTLAVRGMAALFEAVDVIVTPSTDAQLIATNLTGNPAVIVPNGLRGADAPPPPAVDTGDNDNIGGPGTPVSITFLGGLYQDAKAGRFCARLSAGDGLREAAPEAVTSQHDLSQRRGLGDGGRIARVWRPARQPIWRSALQSPLAIAARVASSHAAG